MPDQAIVAAFLWTAFGGTTLLVITSITGLTVFVFVYLLFKQLTQFSDIAASRIGGDKRN